MKSYSGSNTSLVNTFQTLSLNTSSNNATLAGMLLNERYKYFLLRFFDNEGQFTMLTVGPQSLTLSASPNVNDKSGTLSFAWPYISCQQLVVFGDGEQRTAFFTQGNTAITWSSALAGQQFATTAVIAGGATTATLATAWATATQTSLASFSDGSTATVTFTKGSAAISWSGGLAEGVAAYVNVIPTNTALSCVGVQAYPLPANVSKIKNPTITIGQLVYTAYPVNSVQEWTKLNALPYTASYPAYFFIYNKQLQFWPIPAISGEVITLYCQFNAPDMTYTDWGSTGVTVAGGGGTINSMTVGSNAVTGTSTLWNSSGTFPLNTDLTFMNLYLTVVPPGGDGIPYQIQSFQSDTALTLLKPVVYAPNTSGAKYVIGQYPFLDQNFHDAIVYGALEMYFGTIVKDTDKAELFQQRLDEKMTEMEFYLSTKSVNVDLGNSPVQRNPNLFYQGK